MRFSLLALAILIGGPIAASAAAQDGPGYLTANPHAPGAVRPLPGVFADPYGNDSSSPRLYDRQGTFLGNLNANPYDPNSVANPFGRYGSPYSPQSINNPFGRYGSPYGEESPSNPHGQGLRIYMPN